MTSQRRVDRGGKDPKLRDIDHHEHDQTRLPNRGLSRFGAAVRDRRRILRKCLHRQPLSFGVEALLPVAHTWPSRISTSMVSNARGGGP